MGKISSSLFTPRKDSNFFHNCAYHSITLSPDQIFYCHYFHLTFRCSNIFSFIKIISSWLSGVLVKIMLLTQLIFIHVQNKRTATHLKIVCNECFVTKTAYYLDRRRKKDSQPCNNTFKNLYLYFPPFLIASIKKKIVYRPVQHYHKWKAYQ